MQEASSTFNNQSAVMHYIEWDFRYPGQSGLQRLTYKSRTCLLRKNMN